MTPLARELKITIKATLSMLPEREAVAILTELLRDLPMVASVEVMTSDDVVKMSHVLPTTERKPLTE